MYIWQAYGVHMNGYVEKESQKFLWIAKRSDTKQTFPGMLDHLVAGGLVFISITLFFWSILLAVIIFQLSSCFSKL